MDDAIVTSILLEDFLKNTSNPHYGGSVSYARPAAGHGWSPMSSVELIKTMAGHIARNAPHGAGMEWKH